MNNKPDCFVISRLYKVIMFTLYIYELIIPIIKTLNYFDLETLITF